MRKETLRRAGTRAGAAVGRGTLAGLRVATRGGRAGTRRARGYVSSAGAGESGLARLVELHFVNLVGDAALTVSLAGTIFAIPTDEARGQVAQFLALTMAPFALLAPFIGPLLDRFRHGRRWAIGTTVALRAFLCWVLADAVAQHSAWLFPAALGCLVASKAYGVTRAAAVPRLLPTGFTLVSANSRISLAGVAGMAVGGGIAGAVARLGGASWSLRVAFAVYVVGTVLAIRLPARVDSSAGEQSIEDTVPLDVRGLRTRSWVPDGTQREDGTPPSARTRPESRSHPGSRPHPETRSQPETHSHPESRAHPESRSHSETRSLPGRLRARVAALPTSVLAALCRTVGGRLLTGFLTFFVAFLMREHQLRGLSGTLVLALVVGAAGAGNALGTVVGNALRRHRPDVIGSAALVADVLAATATALFYSVWTLLVLAFVAGLAGQLLKLASDAVVQRDVEDSVRTRVFAWSETILQIAWVVGGGIGLALPLIPHLGFGVVAALLALVVLASVRIRLRDRRPPARAV